MVTGYPDFTTPVVHVGAITVEGSVSVLGTVEVKGAVTVSGTVSISGTVTVTGSVTVSGTVSISGTVEVTGSVTVSGTVSISGLVAITGTVAITGAVSIKTTYVDNIVIDKLTVGAYTEDRRTLSNNGATPSWDTATGPSRRAKFFPRGCRGFLSAIEVHCKDAGAAGGTITVYLSPHPSMGYVASADVTVPGEGVAQWRSATFKRMWNYDSLFIFVVGSTADMKWGYDTGTPRDGYYSGTAGASWTGDNVRRWFRAVMKGETVGDLPVAGHVDVTEIPHSGSYYDSQSVSVPSQAAPETTVLTVVGAGHIDSFIWFCAKDGFDFYIYCDGNKAGYINPFFFNAKGFTASTPKHALTEYVAEGECSGIEAVKYEFTREFKITAAQITGAAVDCRIRAIINKIK